MAVRFEANVEPVPGYRLIDRIGSGGFGEVWKCIAPGGIYKAIKIIHGDLRSQDNDLVRYAEQELKSLERVKQVRHPYLLALDRYDIVEGRLLIVMELADCNLWERFRHHRLKGLPGIPRDELMMYMVETAEVLDLMNGEHGLLHLDIKPQNIFLQWNHVKVGDFGQVKDLQGLAAQVTGGITPVYAAPETFDGIVTRACDQYSLACVYQELLTGIRPFDGTSMNQLLMQHLAAPPNLNPSPEFDRPALQRALAKKYDERFPTCKEFVQSLGKGTGSFVQALPTQLPSMAAALLGNVDRSEHLAIESLSNGSSLHLPVERSAATDTPLPLIAYQDEPARAAPAESTGTGSFQPTLIVGLGATGLQVLQRISQSIELRFGNRAELSAVQLLYIDTDPQAFESLKSTHHQDRFGSLKSEESYLARLNRPTYYMKLRVGGRSLTEGWFDPQLLNKLTRTPTTMGNRQFGRLAFVDHYRSLSLAIANKLELCLDPDNLRTTLERTGQELRSNRPRVYIATSLTGGTGSGMLLDAVYSIRYRLKKLGYHNPEIVGLLSVPADAQGEEIPQQVRANVWAALTELNHYSRPESVFQSHYDERFAPVSDGDSPFHAVYILPASVIGPNTPAASNTPTTTKANRKTSSDTKNPPRRDSYYDKHDRAIPDPVALAVARIELDLFSSVGNCAESARPGTTTACGWTVRTFGHSEFSWPRGAVVDRTSRVLAGVMITHWVSPDSSRARHRIPVWVSEKMREFGLDRDSIDTRLNRAATVLFHEPVSVHVARLVEPVMPKGWMARTPDVNKLIAVLDQLGKIVGHVTSTKIATPLEEALRCTANDIACVGVAGLTSAIHGMFDDPNFRVASAEEAIQQIMTYLQVSRSECDAEADRAEKIARTGYDPLMAYIHPQSGAKKPSAQEVGEALRTFPMAQYRASISRRAARLFEHLRTALGETRNDITSFRQRMEEVQRLCVTDLEKSSLAVKLNQLMPVGCPTIEDAAQRYLAVLTDDDLQEVERLVQIAIEETFGGLYQASVNSTLQPETILNLVQTRARFHLNQRLGDVDLAAMFAEKYGSSQSAIDVLTRAFHESTPQLVGKGPWANSAITVLGTPAGAAGEQLRALADRGFPAEDKTHFADTPDEISIYREYPFVPLNILPQLGPAWEAAFANAESNQGTAHARTDITEWIGVDSE